MRRLWKGLLISGLAWIVIGLVVMAGRRRRESTTARKIRRNFAKVTTVSLPLARRVRAGRTHLARLRQRG